MYRIISNRRYQDLLDQSSALQDTTSSQERELVYLRQNIKEKEEKLQEATSKMEGAINILKEFLDAHS